ncbi:MAG: glycosyltransferase [Candidatus Woesearchaeota archaeon]
MPDDQPLHSRADVVAEISWEVCNKVGGIYTVLSSKASHMRSYYDDYLTIGPYFQDKAAYEFDEEEPPEGFSDVFSKLEAEGIRCRYGSWQVKGEPKAVLVDARKLSSKVAEFKSWLWERHGIDSLHASWDFDEPVIWSWACARLVQELVKGPWQGKRLVTHHHEWMAGLSLLFLKEFAPLVRSVFTTHATMLGRSIASRGEDLYGMLDGLDPQAKAYEIGVQEKHLTEKACAHTASVFTTVSEMTAMEAEKVLGREPEVLVLNGFDPERFPTIEETSIKHVTSRERLREFQTYHFFPYYHNFRLDHNLSFAISGRYELGNKGMDVFADALGRLNESLKESGGDRTVTVFFWLLRDNDGVRTEVLENKNYYRHIKQYVEWHSNDILKEVMRDFITSEDPSTHSFYTKEFLREMKKDVLHFKRRGLPPMCTHRFRGEEDDALLRRLRAAGLHNRPEDKVKVVVYPCYLDGNDSLLDLPYYEALAGTHLAVFPSAYEPWGYTPLEAAALGVPTVTTDLAGFGRFVQPKVLEENPGVFVLERHGKSYDETVDGLSGLLKWFTSLDHAERVQHKINAKQLSKLADWQHLVKRYVEAHNLALEEMPELDES